MIYVIKMIAMIFALAGPDFSLGLRRSIFFPTHKFIYGTAKAVLCVFCCYLNPVIFQLRRGLVIIAITSKQPPNLVELTLL